MEKAARMPRDMDRDEYKVVIRPRGGLVVGKAKPTTLMRAITGAAGMDPQSAAEDTVYPNIAQNIIVVSTPSNERAHRYSDIRRLIIDTQAYEVYAYGAAPDNTVKGVIHNIPLEDTQEDIDRHITNSYNSKIIAAHRIGSSEAVVVLFQGDKVPTQVKYAGVMIKCTVYKQHREVCRTCGLVGHRKDVCPTPNITVCYACGKSNPGQHHEGECKPHCKLCGGRHPTGDRHCKNRFKVPFQIKKRQWEAKNAAAAAEARPPPALKIRLSRKDEFPELPGAGKQQRHSSSRGASRERSTSKSRNTTARGAAAGAAWAKVAAAVGGAKQPARPMRPRSSSRSDSRVQALEKMVKEQQETIAKLTRQLEELFVTGRCNPTVPQTIPGKTLQLSAPNPPQLLQPFAPSQTPTIGTTPNQQAPVQLTAMPVTQADTNEERIEDEEEEEEEEEDYEDGEADQENRSRQRTHTKDPCKLGYVTNAARISRIWKRTNKLEAYVKGRLDTQDAKIDRLAARQEETNARLDRLEQFLYEKLGAPNPGTVGHNAATTQQQQQQHG